MRLTNGLYYILPTLILSIFLSAVGYSQDVDEKVKLVFTIHQSRDIYDKSTFGEPPQFAIWLEEQESHTVKTAYVTFKTGTGEFEGKIECPVSLPVWIGVFRKETGLDDFPDPGNNINDKADILVGTGKIGYAITK